MDKSILIHHDKIPGNLLDCFTDENKKAFNYSGNDEFSNLDEYISKEIIQNYLINKKPSIIYIKDNLSANYLELYGLRVAYHIRLSQELADTRYVPIVILSDLDGYTLNKLEPMAKILFTRNIFIKSNSKSTIETFDNKTIKPLDKKEYKSKFLNLIEVVPPGNSTNHSIANEWSIFKWAKELKISSSTDINNTISNISYQIYFKYLYQKNELEEDVVIPEEKKAVIQAGKALRIVKTKEAIEKKILIIDDELDKGWGDIFIEYFKKARGYSTPKTLPIEFINKKYEDIEATILNYINDNTPDLILLDMRLVESDHIEENPENISGIKLLNKIKDRSLETELNPGIQVIMLSATTRSDILEKAYEDNKILGYIKKDHIEDTSIDTKSNINKLDELLRIGEKKFNLKEIWNIQNSILKLIICKNYKYNEVKKEVEFLFEILDSNMDNKFKFAMLTIYKSLEVIKDLYIDDNAKYLHDSKGEIKAIYSKDDVSYQAYDRDIFINGYGQCHYISDIKDARKYYYSTENKIHAISYEILNIKDKEVHDLIKKISHKRNKYIHPVKKNETVEVLNREIIDWFNMLYTILQKVK